MSPSDRRRHLHELRPSGRPQHLDRATPAAGGGLKWIHAEHRIKPEYTYAQTGYMQGAAGIGMLFLRMDALDKGRPWTFRLPDSPYGEKA